MSKFRFKPEIFTNEPTHRPPYHAAIDPTIHEAINYTPKSDPSTAALTFNPHPFANAPNNTIEDITRDQTSELANQEYWDFGNDPLPSIISGGGKGIHEKYLKYKQKYLKLKKKLNK